MKYVKKRKFEAALMINGKRPICKILLEEYKTIWKFTGKADGYEWPFAIQWKYKKSDYKDEIEVVTAFFADVEKQYN